MANRGINRVVIFGKLAEVVGEYVKKGTQLYIEGQLQTRKWQDQSGQDRYTTEVVVNPIGGTMQILGGVNKPDNQQSSQSKQQSKQNEPPVDFDDVPF